MEIRVPKPHQCPTVFFWCSTGLDGRTVQWYHIEMLLKGMPVRYPHARICQSGTSKIPAPHSN